MTLALRRPKAGVRPGRWNETSGPIYKFLLNYNGRPITCHHKHAVLSAYGAILE